MNTLSYKFWLITGIITALVGIVGFIGKFAFTQVLKRLDNIVNELQSLTKITTIQEERIGTLKDNSILYASILATHSEKIIDLGTRTTRLETTLSLTNE